MNSKIDAPKVKTSDGVLSGVIQKDINDKAFIAFLGVPYAKPPVGHLRFQAPKSNDPWEGVRDATKEGNYCYSRYLFSNDLSGSEDCLYLNIYTPSLLVEGDNSRAVMVWIHGAEIATNSRNHTIYGPDFLLSEKVLLVTVNYRSNILGFLSMEDPQDIVSENNGLKDIIMALKWIQNNIAAFGGNPSNITIFGQGFGAVAVHFLVLSPLAKDLFHKAILQSGSAINVKSRGMPSVRVLGEILNIDSKDEYDIVQALKRLPIDELMAAAEKLPDIQYARFGRYFAPVIEISTPGAVISQDPIEIIKSGNYNQVPILIGYTSREGMIVDLMRNSSEFQHDEIDFQLCIPQFFKVKYGSDLSKMVAKRIKKFYFSDSDIYIKDDCYLMDGDNFFVREIIKSAHFHSITSLKPVYMYRLSVESELNFMKKLGDINEPGVCHGDDIGYLFKTSPKQTIERATLEDISRRRICRLWANFAKYGDPIPKRELITNVKWSPVRPLEMNFLDIGRELIAGVNPEKRRMSFWDEIINICVMQKPV